MGACLSEAFEFEETAEEFGIEHSITALFVD
jgi:hypothetical protein